MVAATVPTVNEKAMAFYKLEWLHKMSNARGQKSLYDPCFYDRFLKKPHKISIGKD
jgi:hypothetical protein